MHTKRVIPCLDVKDGRVVKGVKFLNLKDAGDPAEVAAAYDREGADEVVFLDINASADSRATQLEWVRWQVRCLFPSLWVAGYVPWRILRLFCGKELTRLQLIQQQL